MNKRNIFSSIFLTLALSGAAMMPIEASACNGKHHKHMSMNYCHKWKHCYDGLVRGECQMMPGHWWTTVWVPEHKACWYYKS